MSRSYKITLLIALYIAQGLPFGFFTLALPVLAREAGYSLKAITALSLWQADDYRPGLAFAGALAFTLAVLWVTAWLLIWLTRRFFPRKASFPVR